MKLAHFDVDKTIFSYLSGKRLPTSFHESGDVSLEGVTLKSASRVSEAVLDKYPKLKLIVTRTVGTDHIDLAACKNQGIAVYHIEDYGSYNIAEHTWALILSGTRHITQSYTEVKTGRFSYKHWLGLSLKGKTLGTIGTGKIGLEVIKIGKAFGMKIIAYDVFQNLKAQKEIGFEYVSLDSLFTAADVISLHAPLLESTKHLINSAAIKKMKKGVVLVNTARGGLINTAALVKNVEKFSYIGLDVLENEDQFSKNHPLLKCSNVTITPHIGFFSDASIKKIAEETQRAIVNYEQGVKTGRVV